jgi:hypothetical protein
MDVSKGNNGSKSDFLKYNYLLKLGISEVKGGIKVLYDMEYPEEIMDSIKKDDLQKNKLRKFVS